MRHTILHAWRFAIVPLLVLVAASPVLARTVSTAIASDSTTVRTTDSVSSRADSLRRTVARRAVSRGAVSRRAADARRTLSEAGALQDTASVHGALRRSINRFQDSWRRTWQMVEVDRHGTLDLNQIRGYNVQSSGAPLADSPRWEGDRDANNLTPSLRRYLAILCFVDTPTDAEIEAVKSNSNLRIGVPVVGAAEIAAAAAAQASKTTVDMPRGAGGIGRVSPVTPRSIFGPTNNGAICPGWTPDGEPTPLDEGEAIDLAIPPDQREPLRRERETLISELSVALSRNPTDAWIAGQRVRFILDQRSNLTDSRAPDRAIAAARDCQGSEIVCASLRGLALHDADNIPGAEAEFRFADSLAIAAAAPKAPCVAPEVLLVLPPGDRSKVTGQPCGQQREMVERMWWLADPLWSVPGNERYVAHSARITHAGLRSVTDRDERYVWHPLSGGLAMHEMVVRFGWPGYTYWPGGQLEEEMNKLRDAKVRFRAPPYTAKEYSAGRVTLVPKIAAIANPFILDSTHYTLYKPEDTSNEQWWPQEHMSFNTRIAPLASGQQGMWQRDSAIFYAMIVDEPLRNLDTAVTGASTATLISSTGPGNMRRVAQTRVGDGGTMRLLGTIPSTPVVMSAEILGRTLLETSRRVRFGITPPKTLLQMGANDVALSAPVFMRVPNRTMAPPKGIDTVLALMAGNLSFSRNEPLALYWESYGFPLNDSLQLQLRITRNDEVGVARRIAAAVGLASSLRDSLSVNWTEQGVGQGVVIRTTGKTAVGRSVNIDMRALQPGDYIVSFEVRRGAATFARSERKFVLLEN